MPCFAVSNPQCPRVLLHLYVLCFYPGRRGRLLLHSEVNRETQHPSHPPPRPGGPPALCRYPRSANIAQLAATLALYFTVVDHVSPRAGWTGTSQRHIAAMATEARTYPYAPMEVSRVLGCPWAPACFTSLAFSLWSCVTAGPFSLSCGLAKVPLLRRRFPASL